MTARGVAAFPKVKRRVATTWWGKAWVKALEDTALDQSLIRLGRRYAHVGVVGPITVSPGRLHAQVHDDDTLYNTTVHVPASLPWAHPESEMRGTSGAAVRCTTQPHHTPRL